MSRALGQTLNPQQFLYTISFWQPPGKYMNMPLGLFAFSLSVRQTTVKLCQFHHVYSLHSLHTINHVKVLKFKSSANFFLVEMKSGLFRTRCSQQKVACHVRKKYATIFSTYMAPLVTESSGEKSWSQAVGDEFFCRRVSVRAGTWRTFHFSLACVSPTGAQLGLESPGFLTAW